MIVSGSLVVCVNDNFPWYAWIWAKELPRRGNIYTVKKVGRGKEPVTGESRISLILFELNNPLPTKSGQVLFAIERFREYLVALEENDECREWEVDKATQD